MFKFLASLFVRWDLVFSSTDAQTYFEMLEKLRNNGIDYRVKVLNFGGGYGGAEGFNTVYHVYTRKESGLKANDFMHHS